MRWVGAFSFKVAESDGLKELNLRYDSAKMVEENSRIITEYKRIQFRGSI